LVLFRAFDVSHSLTAFAPWAGNPAVNQNVADKPQYVRWRPTATDAAIQQVRTE
jgi:hypothetical protein